MIASRKLTAGPASGQCHAAFGVFEVIRIDRHRLGPAHTGHDHHQQAKRVDVADGIPAQASAIAGCVIPQTIRRKAVGALVKDNADQRSYRLKHQRPKRRQIQILKKILKIGHSLLLSHKYGYGLRIRARFEYYNRKPSKNTSPQSATGGLQQSELL